MKPLHNSTRIIAFVVLAVALVCGTQFTGCTEQPSVTVPNGPAHMGRTYIIPSLPDTFDIGRIHNAELYYIFTHYDTVKYASYPNKLSVAGIDSLAALFIQDSIQPSVGSFTPTEISELEAAFDSAFNAGLTSSPTTHSQVVASVDSEVSDSIIASDEANFIITADTDIRLCTSYAQMNDTISSLTAQYYTTSWNPSTSHGIQAFEYLSIASHSSAFWGQPGDTIPLPPALPVSADASIIAADQNFANNQVNDGYWTPAFAATWLEQQSSGASAGNVTNGGIGIKILSGILVASIVADAVILIIILISI